MSEETEQQQEAILMPTIDVQSGRAIQHLLPEEPDFNDSFIIIMMSLTAVGMIRCEPMYSWVSFFIILSMNINQPIKKRKLNQTTISLLMITFSIVFQYMRIMAGQTTPISN